ncbi:GGDEF domain-containing protein, partial [Aduncisulcus paluster]
NRSMSLIMIDIDNFKAINDRFGHLFGDKVIRRVADAIRGTVRHDDVVGRYGGEEFIVVLSNTPRDVAKDVAEKIRRTVEDLHFDENAKITV